jgi:hypothetical protein
MVVRRKSAKHRDRRTIRHLVRLRAEIDATFVDLRDSYEGAV